MTAFVRAHRINEARGTAVPCFATAEVEKRAQSEEDPAYEKLIKGVAATAYAGKPPPHLPTGTC